MHSDSCLVCHSPSVISEDFPPLSEDALGKTEQLISKENGNPSRWGIHFCSPCSVVVNDLKKVHLEILKLTRVFNSKKVKFLNSVRRSEDRRCIQLRKNGQWESSDIGADGGNNIVAETRKFTIYHNYQELFTSLTNPFKDGDMLAHSMLPRDAVPVVPAVPAVPAVPVVSVVPAVPVVSVVPAVPVVSVVPAGPPVPASYPQTQQVNYNNDPRQKTNPNRNRMYSSILPNSYDGAIDRYLCPWCAKTFSSTTKQKFHAQAAHPEHIFVHARIPGISDLDFRAYCKLILRSDLSPDDISKQSGPTRPTCSQCRKSFTDRRYLQHHWVLSHYEILADRLRNLQKTEATAKNMPSFSNGNPTSLTTEFASSSSSSPRPPASFIPPDAVSASTSPEGQFQCSNCSQKFANPVQLKEHAVYLHPEQFFPASMFGMDGMTKQIYHSLCARLFHMEKSAKTTKNSFFCPMCPESFGSSWQAMWVHFVESHYDQMASKLIHLLNAFTLNSQPTTSAGAAAAFGKITTNGPICLQCPLETPPAPLHHQNPYYNMQQGDNVLHKIVNSSVPGQTIMHQESNFSTTREEGHLKQHPWNSDEYSCVDCGQMFRHASRLSRHRYYYCKIRKAAGLLKGRTDTLQAEQENRQIAVQQQGQETQPQPVSTQQYYFNEPSGSKEHVAISHHHHDGSSVLANSSSSVFTTNNHNDEMISNSDKLNEFFINDDEYAEDTEEERKEIDVKIIVPDTDPLGM